MEGNLGISGNIIILVEMYIEESGLMDSIMTGVSVALHTVTEMCLMDLLLMVFRTMCKSVIASIKLHAHSILAQPFGYGGME